MCGICGYIGSAERRPLAEMLEVLGHRGPDDEGELFDGDVALGMRRLSIIDLERGHQPLSNEDGSVWIVYNGEIYNYRELRRELEGRGHRFSTESDTEVIVHLYEDMGERCVHRLRGMFAFALWDKTDRKLLLARDRIGIKPLFYYRRNGRLVFASEIKSLLRHPDVPKDLNLPSLYYFLTFLYIPAPHTIFKGIKKLPPGHILSWTEGRPVLRQYWDLHFPVPDVRPEEYYRERIYELLRESVRMRMISDVPLGAFLSGGVDSSTVVGLMSEVSSEPVRTFSIGYGRKAESYNELEYARIVARHFGTEHHEYIVEPDVVELLPKIVWYLDEPFADSSTIPTFLVSEVARKHVKVCLSGIGGDEVFGGYPRYIGERLAGYYEILPLILRKHMLAKMVELIPESTESRNIPGWIKRFVRGGALRPEDRYISWISFLDRRQAMRLFRNGPPGDDSLPFDIHRRLYRDNDAGNSLDRIFYLDLKTYLPDDLLAMGDRMSMGNSLELRVPFCDHEVIQFSAGVPYGLKLKGLRLKSVLKKTVQPLLPGPIIKRKKQGFMVPLAKWFQNELGGYVDDLLSRARVEKRGYFRYEYIRWVLDQHHRNRRNFTDLIFALVSLEIWHQMYID